MMMTTTDDEFYSDDSLEAGKKSNRKLKPKKVEPKKYQSYLKLYQHRLATEFVKLKNTNDSICYPTRTASPSHEKSGEELTEVKPQTPVLIAQTMCGPSSFPTKLWSEFLSKKYKIHRPKSEAENKADMLKKRLEYGKRMTRLNKFNIKCMNAEPVKNVLKIKKEVEKAPKVPPEVDSAAQEKVEEPSRLVEINTKLALLKRRHLSDKKLVEKIKDDLKISSE